MREISLASANIPLSAYFNILDCLISERIGRGKYIQRFEELICDYFKVENCIAVANGTLADIIILRALSEKVNDPTRNQVIVPALTFVAQTNAVILAGLHPIFVDVNDDFQMNMDQAKESINKNTLCVFPVHLMGVECKIPKLKVPILEDCCEGMAGAYKKSGLFGTKGLASSFSMYPSHTITTGEGGFILTNDDSFAKICRSIHDHGKTPGAIDFDFSYVGINAKMTNLQAAIGCSLVKTIDSENDKRKDNVDIYNEILGLDFYASSPHGYPVIYECKGKRDSAIETLRENGIEARKLMSCVPNLPAYRKLGYEGKNLNAQRLADCGLYLSCHQSLSVLDIERVCRGLPKP